jgi:hypothetical protein
MKKQLQDILDLLEKFGASTSNDVQAALKISQSNVSRCFVELKDEIFSIGSGRNTRYAIGKPIAGLKSEQPVSLVTENGEVLQLGTLRYLAKSQIHLVSSQVNELFDITPKNPLPWIIDGLKTQGFLGRIVAHKMSAYGYGTNPDLWNSEAVLFVATKIQDTPGALVLGHIDSIKSIDSLRISSKNIGFELDLISADVAKTLPSGSSAGGEQPKFLVSDDQSDSFVVKFSPPLGTPFGDRWSDLLVSESLCSEALREFGFDCSESKIIKTESRTYLLSKRFDRIGEFGRKHVVSIGSAHDAFVKGVYTNWAVTGFDLANQGRLPKIHAESLKKIYQFGHLIGNTDMHSGNASLFVMGENLKDLLSGHFELAPVYDMLPMRWKPNPMMGIYDYESFDPDYSAVGLEMRKAAQCFWLKVSLDDRVSQGLREISKKMASKMGC